MLTGDKKETAINSGHSAGINLCTYVLDGNLEHFRTCEKKIYFFKVRVAIAGNLSK